jgi:hypothetical protein
MGIKGKYNTRLSQVRARLTRGRLLNENTLNRRRTYRRRLRVDELGDCCAKENVEICTILIVRIVDIGFCCRESISPLTRRPTMSV